MKRMCCGKPLAFSVLVAGLWLVSSVQSQDLPKGEDIVDKYVEVTGGKAAYEKVKTRITTVALEVVGVGLEGTIVMYQEAPNKAYTESEIPGAGKGEDGTDGQIVWEKSTITGPRIKQGEERASYFRSHSLDSEVNWRKYYKKAEVKGVEKVEGKDCYKVEMTPNEGSTQTHFYDKATGLLVKSVSKEKIQLGELPVESVILEYKKVDGLMVPYKIRAKMGPTEVQMTLDKIEHNVKIPPERFKLPDDVKKLADKDKK